MSFSQKLVRISLPFVLLLLPFLAFAQPSNDNCFGAITLTASSSCVPISGTTANATQSLPACAGTANDDVWYNFVATQSALSVQVTGATGFNPVLQVFSGGCTSSTSMGCANNTGNGGTETLSFTNLIVGVTYWIRVHHFLATIPTNQTFTICVSPQAIMPLCAGSTPAGNSCEDATLICDVNGYCGSTAASYTVNTWPSLNTAFCGSIENNSFIQFVASASTVSLNVWVTSSTSNLGIQVMIFSTTACQGTVTSHTCVSPVAPAAGPSAITATGLIPGNTYYMMIDGFAGDVCNYVIGVNSGILVSGQVAVPSTNLCLGNSVSLTASGGNGIYTWTASPSLSDTIGAVVVATPTTPGAHVYTMTTNSSNPLCPATSVTNVTINAVAPPTPNAGIDDTVCFGNPISLSGTQTSTANPITWQYIAPPLNPVPVASFSPNFAVLSPTVTVNQPGLYYFVLRETSPVCGINRDTVSILVMNPMQSVTSTQPSCFGLADGEIQISNPQADEFSFDNGLTWVADSSMSGFAAGTYTVCSRNYLNCSVCSSVVVDNPTPMGILVSNDTTICENGTAFLGALASGGASFAYIWNFTTDTLNVQTASPTTNTTYSVFAQNENGCQSATETIEVTVRAPISATSSPTATICPGYPTTLTANALGGLAPYTFTWSSGSVNSGLSSSQTVSPTSGTTYTITVTDMCESTPFVITSDVVVSALPVPAFVSNDPFICEPAQFTLTNLTDTALVDYLYWEVSNGQVFVNQETIQTAPLAAGTYSVQLVVTSPQGCVDSVTYTNYLNVYPQPVANFSYSPNPVLVFSTEVQLTNYSSNGDSYSWIIEQGTPAVSQQKHVVTAFPEGVLGTYNVTLITTSEFGCMDTMTKPISVLPEVIIYAPNTFTPDGDEYNQDWGIFIEGIDIYSFELLIFNRWGETIWESYDPNVKWDGTYKGQPVQQGTYNWIIRAKDAINDGKYEFNGAINLIR
jgi:gliding motility-associated-like protein